MPIFEFKCPECGKMFETICLSSSDEKVKCPKCGSDEPQKILSTFSFQDFLRPRGGLSSCGPRKSKFS